MEKIHPIPTDENTNVTSHVTQELLKHSALALIGWTQKLPTYFVQHKTRSSVFGSYSTGHIFWVMEMYLDVKCLVTWHVPCHLTCQVRCQMSFHVMFHVISSVMRHVKYIVTIYMLTM